MTIYTVLAPPAGDRRGRPDPAAFVFVKEGFCWPALFFPRLWLLFRRHVAGACSSTSSSRSAVAGARRRDRRRRCPASFLVLARFLFALEANELRRWTLERRG